MTESQIGAVRFGIIDANGQMDGRTFPTRGDAEALCPVGSRVLEGKVVGGGDGFLSETVAFEVSGIGDLQAWLSDRRTTK